MVIQKRPDLRWSDVTPRAAYLGRREFLQAVGLAAAASGAGLLSASDVEAQTGQKIPNVKKGPFGTDEALTPYKDVTTYNNFYEFGTDKDDPARERRRRCKTAAVDGDASTASATKRRDVRTSRTSSSRRRSRSASTGMRCVEAWSMVIPVGRLSARRPAQAGASRRRRRSSSSSRRSHDPKQMPGQRRAVLDWPYVEGLRLDEAMHPLTILAVGLYGEVLPNQNGAPLRLVVPWKYGFKGIKSIVRIRFVETAAARQRGMRPTPSEYGFYSNVNPEVDHPRWSQANERRIGEFFKRPTLMFNGYGDQVASLYAGMDLKKNY